MKTVLTAVLATAWAGWACAGEISLPPQAQFAAKPTAAKDGDKTKISFAAAAPTDCEVAVLDAAGKVVRHLAAGQIGGEGRLPEPLKAGLAQSLEWDGKDDFGQPAAGGPFKVRVALGLKPEFEKTIGDNPGGLGYIVGLATGPDGTLYAMNNFGDLHPADGSTVCQAYDRTGKYLRQVIPYRGDLPEEKIGGLKRIEVGGRKVPYIYNAETRSVVPGLGNLPSQRFVVARDGRLAFVGLHESGHTLTYNRAGPNRLTVINADGGAPAKGPLGATLARSSTSCANLALSPDERTLYAAGIADNGKPQHAVFAVGWDDAEPRVFAGKPAEAGAGATGFSSPRAVAVDKDGNVYVADHGNNRVAAFKPDGAFLGEIAFDQPEQVEVHPRTGAIYVLGGPNCKALAKFASLKDARPAATATLKVYEPPKGGNRLVMALDGSADPAVLWLGTSCDWSGYKLLRLEDQGGAFSKPVDIAKLPGNDLPDAGPRRRYNLATAGSIHGMALDRANRKLYLNKRAYDLNAGKWGPGLEVADGCKEGAGSFGLDGNYYAQVQVWNNSIVRYSPAGAPLPFPDSKAKNGGLEPGTSFRLRGRGIAADQSGNIYSLNQVGKTKPGNADDANSLVKYGPDGQVLNAALIDSAIRGLNSVCVDPRGNLWVGIGARPAGKGVPDHLAAQALGKAYKVKETDLTTDFNWYPFLYGSIVKFPPAGGEVRDGIGGVKMEYSSGSKIEIKGAEWVHFGASPMPSWRLAYPGSCLCESPRFDVDGYGRCFFPDAAGFRVGMLDTAGNLLGWFGTYGNQDSPAASSGQAVPKPEIAFHWPWLVCVEDGWAYIGDRINRRVVVVKLGHAAEETCEVK